MGMYANVHAILEKQRKNAEEIGSPGPRILVCGPTVIMILKNNILNDKINKFFLYKKRIQENHHYVKFY